MAYQNRQTGVGFNDGFLTQRQLPADNHGYSNHLHADTQSLRDGHSSFYSITDWAGSVSVAPSINFPEPSMAGFSCGASSADRPRMPSFMAPAMPRSQVFPTPPNGITTTSQMVQERRGSGILRRVVERLSSIEVVPCNPDLAVGSPTSPDTVDSFAVATVSSEEEIRENEVLNKAKRMGQFLMGLTPVVTIPFAIFLLLPIAAVVPITVTISEPLQEMNWREVHQSHRAIVEAYLDSYSNFIAQVAAVPATLFKNRVFDPEDPDMLSMACELATTVRAGSMAKYVSIVSLGSSKLALCATRFVTTSGADADFAGFASHNKTIDNIYAVDCSTFTFAEPLELVDIVAPEFTDVEAVLIPRYLSQAATARLVSDLREGNLFAEPPLALSWWFESQQNFMFFTFPFAVLSIENTTGNRRVSDVAVIEVKIDSTALGQATRMNTTGDNMRVAFFSPVNISGDDPILISNSWGQPVVEDGKRCMWSWCSERRRRLRASEISDEYVSAAVKHLGFGRLGAAVEANRAVGQFGETVLFRQNGAHVCATLWVYMTFADSTFIVLMVSAEEPVTGPYRTIYLLVFCLAYILPSIMIIALFACFIEVMLTRPLRAMTHAVNTGVDFGKERDSEDESARQRRRRALNPLRAGKKKGDLEALNEEGDGYLNDELMRRVSVLKTGKLLRFSEMETLQTNFNAVMAQLRAADTYVPQAVAMTERFRFLSTTSTWTPKEEGSSMREHCGNASRTTSSSTSNRSSLGCQNEAHQLAAGLVRSESSSSQESLMGENSQASEHNSFTSHERVGESGKGELTYLDLLTTLVFISPRDQNVLPTSLVNTKKRHYRTRIHNGKHSFFPSAFGMEQFFNNTSKFADRFGGVISTMAPELTLVMFNAPMLATRTAFARAPPAFGQAGVRYEMETKAAAADAVAAVRFALTLDRCFQRESRLIPAMQIMVDSVICRLSRYYSPSQQQNYLFVQGRDIYTSFGCIPLQLRIPASLTEETALMGWKEVRCIPVEAVKSEQRAIFSARGPHGVGSVAGPSADEPQHVIFYEALRGSAHSTSWCQYRGSFTAAFMPMLRGDYKTALDIFQSIPSIEDLDPPLLPSSTENYEESRVLSTGGSARARRNRGPSAVTWKDVPMSHRDSTEGGTNQLERMTAICARNVEKGVTRPYVHSVTVTGFVAASLDLQDPPSERPAPLLAPPPLEVIASKKRRRNKRRRRRRQMNSRRLALSTGDMVTKTVNPRSLLGVVVKSLPKSVEDSPGVVWELHFGDEAPEGLKRPEAPQADANGAGPVKKQHQHHPLSAVSPLTGAIASVEVRLLSDATSLSRNSRSFNTSVNSSTNLSTCSGDSANLGGSRLGGAADANAEEGHQLPTLRVADSTAAACPFLHPYFGYLICQPTVDAMLLLSQFHRDDTLLDHIKRFGRELPLGFVLSVSLSVLTGLEFLHSRGRVHGDLLPENILLTTATHLVPVFPTAAATTSFRTSQVPVLQQERKLSVRLKGYVLAGTEGRYSTAGSAYAPPRYCQVVPAPDAHDAEPSSGRAKSKHDVVVEDTPSWDLFSFGLVLLTLLRQRLSWEFVAWVPPPTDKEVTDSEETEETAERLARVVAKGGASFAREVGRGVFVVASRRESDPAKAPNVIPTVRESVPAADELELQRVHALTEIALQCLGRSGKGCLTVGGIFDAVRNVKEGLTKT